jgi:hypothetical protein
MKFRREASCALHSPSVIGMQHHLLRRWFRAHKYRASLPLPARCFPFPTPASRRSRTRWRSSPLSRFLGIRTRTGRRSQAPSALSFCQRCKVRSLSEITAQARSWLATAATASASRPSPVRAVGGGHHSSSSHSAWNFFQDPQRGRLRQRTVIAHNLALKFRWTMSSIRSTAGPGPRRAGACAGPRAT